MSGYCQSCKWELYRSLEVLTVSLGLPVFLPASLPLSAGCGAAATIVVKVMAAMKEMMDLWNNIVKNVV